MQVRLRAKASLVKHGLHWGWFDASVTQKRRHLEVIPVLDNERMLGFELVPWREGAHLSITKSGLETLTRGGR